MRIVTILLWVTLALSLVTMFAYGITDVERFYRLNVADDERVVKRFAATPTKGDVVAVIICDERDRRVSKKLLKSLCDQSARPQRIDVEAKNAKIEIPAAYRSIVSVHPLGTIRVRDRDAGTKHVALRNVDVQLPYDFVEKHST